MSTRDSERSWLRLDGAGPVSRALQLHRIESAIGYTHILTATHAQRQHFGSARTGNIERSCNKLAAQ